MEKLLKTLGISTLTLAFVLAATGCATTTNEETTDETTEEVDDGGAIVLGGIAPLTGDAAAYGIPISTIADIAVEKLNEEGGINGREVSIVWEDGKCNGQDAASAAQKLINVDKVKVIIGGFCSSETLGAAPIAEQAGVVMVSPGSSSPDITDAGDFIFRTYPSDSAQAKILAEEAEALGLEKVGILTEEQDYTIGIEQAFIAEFDGEVVAENFLGTDSDLKTQITKLKNEGVDGFFINTQTPAKGELMVKQLQELGYEGQLFANDIFAGSTEVIQTNAELLEGTITALVAYDAESEGFQYFEAKYLEQTGEESVPWTSYSATAYDAVMVVAEAIAANGHTATGVRDFLYTVSNWPGAGGSLTLDENGDPEAGHSAHLITNGEVVAK